MIWLLHFIIVTLLLIVSKLMQNDDFFINSSFCYALIVFGQRWMTGTDFPNYLRYSLTNFQVREPLYKFIQNILIEYDLYFGILIFIIFAITLLNNYRFMLKIDRNIVIIIYMYLLSEIFFAQLSQIRQFIAISFFINAYFNTFQKKYCHSLINILLGAGFHTSIIFLIPFIFIKINVTRIKAIYLLVLSAVLPLFDITLLLKLPFFSRYSSYIESKYNVNLSIFHLLKFYTLLLIIFIFIWNLKKYKNVPLDQMILNGILFSMLIYGLSFQFAPMIRINAFFKVFEFIFLVYFINEVNNFSKVIKKIIIISLLLITYVGTVITDPYNITSYQFRHLRLHEDKTTEQLWQEIRSYP